MHFAGRSAAFGDFAHTARAGCLEADEEVRKEGFEFADGCDGHRFPDPDGPALRNS